MTPLSRYVPAVKSVLLALCSAAGAVCAPHLNAQPGTATPRQHNEWHHHIGGAPLSRATELVQNPAVGDTVRVRVSGVWWNRTNFNLWKSQPSGFFASTACLVHGFIEENQPQNVPRFKFTGSEWRTDPQAVSARPLVIRAFAEWSALAADAGVGQALVTGLEFREVGPDSPAEIEIRWHALRAAAAVNRSVSSSGVASKITLTLNSSNDWAFGAAAATRQGQRHFYSTALHEVGHLVGLWESRDTSSVMIYTRRLGPNGPSFDSIDNGSRRAALALYSRPAQPEEGAVPETCVERGLLPARPEFRILSH
jgi:hypothetical protein